MHEFMYIIYYMDTQKIIFKEINNINMLFIDLLMKVIPQVSDMFLQLTQKNVKKHVYTAFLFTK